MTKRKEHEVGRFTATIPIVVRREIEVGTMWEAEAVGLNLAALGRTPDEAVRGLFESISEHRIGGYGNSDDKLLAKLAATPGETDV